MTKTFITLFVLLFMGNSFASTEQIYECVHNTTVVKLFKDINNSTHFEALAFDVYDKAALKSCSTENYSGHTTLVKCNGSWGENGLQINNPATLLFYFQLNPYSNHPEEDIKVYAQINRNPAWTKGEVVGLKCHASNEAAKSALDNRKCWYPDDSNPLCFQK